MDAILLLCDHAVAVEGKLYINGAGWNQVLADRPIQVGLAIKISVPWDQTNIRHTMEIGLFTEDGQPVNDPNGQQWRAQGNFELGRPPGIRQGIPQDVPMAVNFPSIAFAPGGYRWELKIDGEPAVGASFQSIGAQ